MSTEARGSLPSDSPSPDSLRTGIFLGLTAHSFNRLREAIHAALPRVKEIVSAEVVDPASIGPRIPGFTITPASKLQEALGNDPDAAQEKLDLLADGLGRLAGEEIQFPVRFGPVRTSHSMQRPVKYAIGLDGRPIARANITLMVDPSDAGLVALSAIGARIGGVLEASGLDPALARTDEDHMAILEYDRVKGRTLTPQTRTQIATAVGDTIHEFETEVVTVGAIVLGANARQPVLTSTDNAALWPLAQPEA